MKKYFLLFFLAIALAFVTRFYLLGKAPVGVDLDEAAQGYNAYSILKTGKDEFGKPFPIVFRSFADFKTPVYIYLIVPLLPVFGLTAFTDRFPSFFASMLTFPILFLLILKLTPSKKNPFFLAAVTSLILSISPWHILFARSNFECNVALFIFLTGIYLFYLGLEKPFLLTLSAVFLALAIPAYHSERLLVPFILLYFIFFFRKIIFDSKHRLFALVGICLGILIMIPTLSIAITPGFLARLNTLSLGAGGFPGVITSYHGPLENLINAPWYLGIKNFLSLYISYFSPRNLFFLGDSGPRSSYPELSTLFFWQLPFYLHGLYILVKKKEYGQLRRLTLFLLLVAPLPAAFTRDPFSTIRSLPLVIPISIIISLSLCELWVKLQNSWQKIIVTLVSLTLVIFSLLKLYSSAIILNEYFRAPNWGYGLKEVSDTITFGTDNNLPVVVDNARGEPYSQLLFYLKYDPLIYQQENFEISPDQYYSNLNRNTSKHIGRVSVRPINWEFDLAKDQYLVGDYLAISPEQIERHRLDLIIEIKYPDGSPAYRIVRTNPLFNSIRINSK